MLYQQTLTGPAKVAGQVVLALESITFTQNFRKAWAYSPGQRRVKRAPQIVYDNPITAGDGLGTTDQDYARYELHRVWIIEANLKEGTNRATELQYDFNAHRMLALMMDKSKAPVLPGELRIATLRLQRCAEGVFAS